MLPGNNTKQHHISCGDTITVKKSVAAAVAYHLQFMGQPWEGEIRADSALCRLLS